MRRDGPPLPDDGIYRTILLVLVLSVVAGAVIALLGEMVYHDEAISSLGGWIAIVCGGLYFVFRWLGRREARRSRNARRGQGEARRDDAWNDFDERDE